MNSHSLLAAIAAVTLTTSTLFARIGETEQECAARYGEPIHKFPDNIFLYQKSDIDIHITFVNGIAVLIAYRRSVKGQHMSEKEVEILLKRNSGGVPWHKLGGLWETENGELVAKYNFGRHMLLIANRDYLARERQKGR